MAAFNDTEKERFQEVEIKGHYGLFTDSHVDGARIPEGLYCYELRHGDDDSYPAALELSVVVNYFGMVLMSDKLELGENGMIELSYDDFGFTGEELSMLEYQANYLKEPECFQNAVAFVKFMDENDILFHLTEKEAELLLSYMSGHDFVLGEKDGKLFRGDLSYREGKIRWTEDTIDDVVDVVCEWNNDLLEKTQEEVHNPMNFADFTEKKNRLDSLQGEEKVLDVLFDRTKYGKELDEIAHRLAEEFIRNIKSEGEIDEAVKRMTEAVAEGKGIIENLSPEVREKRGKVR